jgi:hypothetical protein
LNAIDLEQKMVEYIGGSLEIVFETLPVIDHEPA